MPDHSNSGGDQHYNSYLNIINSYQDIMVMPRVGKKEMKKLCQDTKVKEALNIFITEYPDFKGYPLYQLFGLLNMIRDVDTILSTVPKCSICHTGRCIIKWDFHGWAINQPIFNDYCNDSECRTKAYHKRSLEKFTENVKKKVDKPVKAKIVKHREYTTDVIVPMVSTSIGKTEVLDYITSIYKGTIICDQQIDFDDSYSMILDIYIPDKRIAFQFDDLLTHSESKNDTDLYHRKNKSYHINETNHCNRINIRLIHIFENEWIYKPLIVKSRIKNLLGLCDLRIFARKCTIGNVDNTTAINFVNANHIQGSITSKVKIGLFYQNDLVSVMTFGKPRFSNKYEWELLRLCNLVNTSVVGGASKLLSYFEKTYNPKCIVSYADRRWSNGGVYEKLGFTFADISQPNYWYWKDSYTLYSRLKYQKHKLGDILPIFNPNLSEVDNMYNNGYNRIFDCGNLVYVKNL